MALEFQGIGPYRLLAIVGEGERAIVYRGVPEDPSIGSTELAVKVLRPGLGDDPEAARQLEERGAACRKLRTPLLLGVQDVGDADGRPYVVAQLCHGISLEELPVRRSNGRLKPEAAIWVLRSVLEALTQALDQGEDSLVHGRLDAGDVRIDTTGGVRLAGFGMKGDSQTDLLAVARLAQDLCRQWPLSVDAWIDRLQDGDEAFGDPAEALEALPLEAFSGDVMDRGRSILARAAQRIVRKREPVEDSTDKGSETPLDGQEALGIGAFPSPLAIPDAGALFQAAGVAWFCAAVIFGAIAVEIMQFGP